MVFSDQLFIAISVPFMIVRSLGNRNELPGQSRFRDATRILGFFTLSACEAVSTDLPAQLAKRLPRTVPAALLGRLAVDARSQGQGLGGVLLVEAIRKVALAASHIGIVGLFVDAKDEPAASFYSTFGFVPLPSNPHRLFLPIETLLQVAGA